MNSTQASGDQGCVFLLRIDCEHPEARRWSGSEEIEAVGLRRLLLLLDELSITATFAFVGATALQFPRLARDCVAQGHAIAGHSMRHDGRYAGRPEAWQLADMREMVAAIQHACDVRIRGLAAPDHGAIDETTLRAAADAGLDYVLNLSIYATSGDILGPSQAGPPSVYVPSARLRFLWDWTDLQPGWPPFSAREAQQEWQASIDQGSRTAMPVSLIIHPWIVESNQEYDLLAAILHYVRQGGGKFCTFDSLLLGLPGSANPTLST